MTRMSPVPGGKPYVTAAPMVSGLVAYFRALPGWGDRLQSPADVKKLVMKMRRVVQLSQREEDPNPWKDPSTGNTYGILVSPAWNGQLGSGVSCLTQPNAPGCPVIDLNDPTPVGLLCESQPITKRGLALQMSENGTLVFRQDGGNSCPVGSGGGDGTGGGGGTGGAGGQGPAETITFESGQPSPTCTAGCGTLCTDYWCTPAVDRTGQPPFFTDPANLPSSSSASGGHTDPTSTGPLPTLSTTSLPNNCVSTTVVPVCNGFGPNEVCLQTTSCVSTWDSTAPLPTLSHTSDPPIPTNCASTSTWTSCAVGIGAGHTACVTHSSCVATSTNQPSPTTTSGGGGGGSGGGGGGSGGGDPGAGLPAPIDITGMTLECSSNLCGSEALGSCNSAAQTFINKPKTKFGTGSGETNTFCVGSNVVDSGEFPNPNGCYIVLEQLLLGNNAGEECVWTGVQAGGWYSAIVNGCGEPCGLLTDPVSNCTMDIQAVKNCPSNKRVLAGRRGMLPELW
jgi:hypothetical protein